MRACLLDSVVELELPPALVPLLEPLVPVGGSAPATARVRVEADGSGYAVFGPEEVRRDLDATSAVEVVLEVLNRLALAQCADLAVHAGAVARGGSVVAFPADSGTGKTTLVCALLQDGWEYVSDEALVISADGRVRSYPKWLSVHRWTLDRLGLPPAPAGRAERALPAAELGAEPAADGLTVAHVVLPVRRPGAAELRPVPRGAAAAELLRCSFNHYRDPAGSVALVSGALRTAEAWTLELDDPVLAAEHLSRRLG